MVIEDLLAIGLGHLEDYRNKSVTELARVYLNLGPSSKLIEKHIWGINGFRSLGGFRSMNSGGVQNQSTLAVPLSAS